MEVVLKEVVFYGEHHFMVGGIIQDLRGQSHSLAV